MPETFTTNDMSLAAYLCSEGHWFTGISRLTPTSRKAVWTFAACEAVHQLVEHYKTGLATVNPLTYTKTLADVREALFDHLNGEG